MSKIVNLNGRLFEILGDISPEQENEIMNSISKLATGCGITIPKGTTKNIRCSASSGTGRYLYELYMNGTKVASSPAGTGGSYTFSYTFNNAGVINVSIKVTDDCSTPSTCNESNCTVTVLDQSTIVATIELTGCDAAHVVGGDCTITPTCKDSTGAIIACPTLAWSSGSPSKISVTPTTNNKGLCTFLADGSSVITASVGGVSGSKTVFVGSTTGKPILTSMTPLEIPIGIPYSITVTGSNFDSGANFESYNPDGTLSGTSASHNPVRTSTSITFTGTVTDVTRIGPYTARVRNGDGQLSDNSITYHVTEGTTCQTPVCNFTIE